MVVEAIFSQNRTGSGRDERVSIEQLKAALDLVGIAGELHPTLKKVGSHLYQGGHDGVHESTRGQCLTVWPDTATWKCFHCQRGGDVLDLIGVATFGSAYTGRGTEFQTVLAAAAGRAGITLPTTNHSVYNPKNDQEAQQVFELLTDCATWFYLQLQQYPEIMTWLEQNYGFTPEFIQKKQIGFAPPLREGSPDPLVTHLLELGYTQEEMKAAGIINRGGYCRFQGRVVFPFWQKEQVVYFAARATKLTPENRYETTPGGEVKKYLKLKTRDEANPHISEYIRNDWPFGLDSLPLAPRKGYLVITEGLTDQLAAEQAGEPCIAAGTTRFSSGMWERLLPLLPRSLTIYLCFDNEAHRAGEQGAVEIAEKLERAGYRVYLIRLPRPEGVAKLDLCEFLRDNGALSLTGLYSSALRLPDYRLEYGALPVRSEDKAIFLTKLAGLALLCHLDPVSLEALQQKAIARLGVSLRTVKTIFKDPAPDPATQVDIPTSAESSPDFSDKAGKPEKRSQAEMVMELMQNAELFHTAEGKAFCTFELLGHFETWPVRSRYFKVAVRRIFFDKYQTPLKTQPLEDAIATLEALAMDGKPTPVYGRLASYEGAIYYDLTNPDWEVVKITTEGWEVLPYSPVKFRRTPGLVAQVTPEKGGKLSDLLGFVNVSEQEWTLLAAWLVTALNPDCQFPVLCISGEQGSAKSTASRFIRRLIDPSVSLLRTSPRDERDLWISTNNNWVLAYDNLSLIPAWLSDGWCRIATGGGNATRMLYSDDEEVYFDARRPILTNGIEVLATRSDLLDRSLILTLPALAEDQRRGEKELVAEFEAQLPYLLGGLFDAISVALARQGTFRVEKLPRMADFTLWSMAAEPAFGGPEHYSFLESYRRQREESHSLALEASTFGQVFLRWYESYQSRNEEPWLGTATELLMQIEASLPEGEKQHLIRQIGWPKNGRALSVVLHRLAPNLRAEGFSLEFDLFRGELKRGICISRETPPSTIQPDVNTFPDWNTKCGETPVTQTVTQKDGVEKVCVPAEIAGFEPGNDAIAPDTRQNTQNLQDFSLCHSDENFPGTPASPDSNAGPGHHQNILDKKSEEGKTSVFCVTADHFEPEDVLNHSTQTETRAQEAEVCVPSTGTQSCSADGTEQNASQYQLFMAELSLCSDNYQALLRLQGRIEQSGLEPSLKSQLLSRLISTRDKLVGWDNHRHYPRRRDL